MTQLQAPASSLATKCSTADRVPGQTPQGPKPKPLLTILPEAKMSAVVFGSLILMMTAAKRCGQGGTGQAGGGPWHARLGRGQASRCRPPQANATPLPSLRLACSAADCHRCPPWPHLWVVLCVPCVQRNLLEVQLHPKVDGGDNVLQLRHDARPVLGQVDLGRWRHRRSLSRGGVGHGCRRAGLPVTRVRDAGVWEPATGSRLGPPSVRACPPATLRCRGGVLRPRGACPSGPTACTAGRSRLPGRRAEGGKGGCVVCCAAQLVGSSSSRGPVKGLTSTAANHAVLGCTGPLGAGLCSLLHTPNFSSLVPKAALVC